MDRITDILRNNLKDVEGRIASACARAGRNRSEVTLVAVTKYVGAATARQLFALGVTNLGESRPQELWKKAAAIPEATWHLVGHLQRNKLERTLPLVSLIHSVDSIRLLEALEAQDRPCQVLLEFNLSGEVNKTGLPARESDAIARRFGVLRNVRVEGLMTMAALDSTPEQARETFAALRDLRQRFREFLNNPAALPNLSMGMTNDYEVAIAEGATHLRIGSALFRGLEGLGP